MKTIKLLLCILVTTFANISAQTCGNWADISLPGTNKVVQAFDVANNVLFACSNFDLLKSTDNGLTWQNCTISNLQYSSSSMLKVKYSAINNTYFLCYAGDFYYSTNGGNSWVTSPTIQFADNLNYILNDSLFFDSNGAQQKLSVFDIGSTNISPTSVTNFRMFAKTTSNFFLFSYSGSNITVYRSANSVYNGVNISANLPVSQFLGGLTAKGDTLFIRDVPNKKYYRSVDQGNSWSLFYDFGAAGALDAIMTISANNIYVFMISAGSYYSGIKCSNDNGVTWQNIALSSTNMSFAVCNNSLITLSFSGTGTSLYQVSGSLPTLINILSAFNNSYIRFANQSQNKILVSSSGGSGIKLHLSADNGNTYNEITSVSAAAYGAVLTSQMIILNYGGFTSNKSYDNGNTWSSCPTHTSYISKGDTVYGFQNGTSNKVYYSYNGGLSFDSVNVTQNFSSGACVNGGFVTYDLGNSTNFSYYKNSTHTVTLFNASFLMGYNHFNATDFAGKKILITDDSTNVQIGYSSDNFQTIQQAIVNSTSVITPLAVFVENNKLIITYDNGYLQSTDGITFNDMSNQDTCISSIIWNENSKKIAYKYYLATITSIAKTKLLIQTTAQNCNAQFMLVADTVPHHYFALNQSTGAGNLNYVWNWGDGSAISTGATPSHTFANAGFYNICLAITNGNGCSSSYCDTSAIAKSMANTIISVDVVNQLPSYLSVLNATDSSNNFASIYPNPTNGIFEVKNVDNGNIEVFNIMGEPVFNMRISKSNQAINLSSMSNGIYFCKITNDNNLKQTIKLIKQ